MQERELFTPNIGQTSAGFAPTQYMLKRPRRLPLLSGVAFRSANAFGFTLTNRATCTNLVYDDEELCLWVF